MIATHIIARGIKEIFIFIIELDYVFKAITILFEQNKNLVLYFLFF